MFILFVAALVLGPCYIATIAGLKRSVAEFDATNRGGRRYDAARWLVLRALAFLAITLLLAAVLDGLAKGISPTTTFTGVLP